MRSQPGDEPSSASGVDGGPGALLDPKLPDRSGRDRLAGCRVDHPDLDPGQRSAHRGQPLGRVVTGREDGDRAKGLGLAEGVGQPHAGQSNGCRADELG